MNCLLQKTERKNEIWVKRRNLGKSTKSGNDQCSTLFIHLKKII